jgi:chromate transporter
MAHPPRERGGGSRSPSLAEVAARWGRIGCVGVGGPPAHITLLRELCVEEHRWISSRDFEDAIAACNLLPGPASTQLAIFCGWHVAGPLGAIVGGLAFILPGLASILVLAALFLATSPPTWVLGAGAGAGAAVAAVALRAGYDLVAPSRRRASSRFRWAIYALLGGTAAATVGPWIVGVLLVCGVAEVLAAGGRNDVQTQTWPLAGTVAGLAAATGGLLSLAWVALKVGALSYGGGFVIIPLMQADAVQHHHWMTNAQFLDAVALGQVTPGPVVHTVAVVGYAAAGLAGGLLAATVAFVPSFVFVLVGAAHFDRLRRDARARAFLNGAGPAAIGAIIGVAIPLALSLEHPWQYAVLAAAAVAVLPLRRSVVITLVTAGGIGAIASQLGMPVR